MRAILLIGAAGLALSGLVAAPPVFAADQLTIVTWGGFSNVVGRKAFFDPFTKQTGIKVIDEEWNGEVSKVRAMVDSKTVSWDVVDVGADVQTMCNEGIVETLDWNKLGLDRTMFMGGEKQECGVPHNLSATVLAYNKDKLANGPKSIADLFDLQKFPGKRGLGKNPTSNLVWALIADGVAAKDVFNVLRTREGVDRAFKKLDTIKKDVIWWTSGAQPPQLLADGQVVMAAAYQSRIHDAVKNSGKNFEIVWDAPLLSVDFFVIPKGSSRREEAYKFLAFAGTPKPQADLTLYVPYGPARKDALSFVDPAVLPQLATSPDHLPKAVLYDYAFMSENGDDLRQRFTAWLAQ